MRKKQGRIRGSRRCAKAVDERHTSLQLSADSRSLRPSRQGNQQWFSAYRDDSVKCRCGDDRLCEIPLESLPQTFGGAHGVSLALVIEAIAA
jgi:hypothetical protein